jgi:hypothetical protein
MYLHSAACCMKCSAGVIGKLQCLAMSGTGQCGGNTGTMSWFLFDVGSASADNDGESPIHVRIWVVGDVPRDVAPATPSAHLRHSADYAALFPRSSSA